MNSLMDSDEIQSWVGREDEQRDLIDVVRARRMHALLDRPPDELEPGTTLPPGYHWLFCAGITRRSEWGPDGHPRRGGFLPPFPGTRRMWAGGSLRFLQPLHIGDAVQRHSTIHSIEEKTGRAGRFHLIRIAHRLITTDRTVIEEEQQLVFLPAGTPASTRGGKPFAQKPDWQDTFVADEVALFFFSALTMNGHRIHYDHPYATRAEGHPHLLVHAPFTALLLLDVARRNGCTVRTFDYRAIAPLFCRETITLAGSVQPDGAIGLRALRPDGTIAMDATASR